MCVATERDARSLTLSLAMLARSSSRSWRICPTTSRSFDSPVPGVSDIDAVSIERESRIADAELANLFINHRFFKVCGVLVRWTAPHTTHERAHTPRTYNASTPNPSLLPIHAGCVPACLFGARVVQRGAALKRCVVRRVFSPVSVLNYTRAPPSCTPPCRIP